MIDLRFIPLEKNVMFKDGLRSGGITIHKSFAHWRWTSQLYLVLWSILLRKVPDSRIKRQIINTLSVIKWPLLDLKPRKIRIVNNIEINVFPHVGEFDFAALFNTDLTYEKEVFVQLASRIHQYDSIVEIGANVGIYTLFFSRVFEGLNKTDSIFAFEPSREAFYRLYQNLKLNSAKNVHIFNCAIAEYIDFVEFFEPQGHLTNGSLSAPFAKMFTSDVEICRVLTINGEKLQTLITAGKKTLLKIDVEGAERNVLCSLKDFILTQTPDLVIEVLSSEEDKLNGLDFLTTNYALFQITNRGLVSQDKFKAGEFRDYLLLPKVSSVT